MLYIMAKQTFQLRAISVTHSNSVICFKSINNTQLNITRAIVSNLKNSDMVIFSKFSNISKLLTDILSAVIKGVKELL